MDTAASGDGLGEAGWPHLPLCYSDIFFRCRAFSRNTVWGMSEEVKCDQRKFISQLPLVEGSLPWTSSIPGASEGSCPLHGTRPAPLPGTSHCLQFSHSLSLLPSSSAHSRVGRKFIIHCLLKFNNNHLLSPFATCQALC